MKKSWIIVAAVLAAGILYYLFIFDSPEKQVRKRFALLAEKLEKSPGENPLISASKAKGAAGLFAPIAVFDMPEYNFRKEVDPGNLAQYILAARSRYSAISVHFYDFSFERLEEEMVRVIVTVGIRATAAAGQKQEDIQEVACRLERLEGDWKFSEMKAVEVLER